MIENELSTASPRLFLDKIVIPNAKEFYLSNDNIRLAFNAVAAVDALAAQIYFWSKHNAPHTVIGMADDIFYRQYLASQHSDFGLLRDIAKAQEHVLLTRGKPQLSHAGQIKTQALGWDNARWDEGLWDSIPQVVVVTDIGEYRVVQILIQQSMILLEQEIKRVGIP